MQYGKSSLVLILIAMVASAGVQAQDRLYPHVGRTPTTEEIREWDIAIGPEGEELPPGSGTAREGEKIFFQKCVACHGQNLEGGIGAPLVGGQGTLGTLEPVKTIGSYWPFATSIWDYINRAMPPNNYNVPVPPDQKLTAGDVYALTAFLLFRNGIVGEDDIIDADTLPKVDMPNRNGFVPVDLNDALDYRGRGCRFGTCP
jgi:S-disulfanyl-L-cysteine oxidoreductase SoxD